MSLSLSQIETQKVRDKVIRVIETLPPGAAAVSPLEEALSSLQRALNLLRAEGR